MDELARLCERRGWRLLIAGTYHQGRDQAGLEIRTLEIHTRDRALLVQVDCDPGRLEEAFADAKRALVRQGLTR
jgi:hypothetical protein